MKDFVYCSECEKIFNFDELSMRTYNNVCGNNVDEYYCPSCGESEYLEDIKPLEEIIENCIKLTDKAINNIVEIYNLMQEILESDKRIKK